MSIAQGPEMDTIRVLTESKEDIDTPIPEEVTAEDVGSILANVAEEDQKVIAALKELAPYLPPPSEAEETSDPAGPGSELASEVKELVEGSPNNRQGGGAATAKRTRGGKAAVPNRKIGVKPGGIVPTPASLGLITEAIIGFRCKKTSLGLKGEGCKEMLRKTLRMVTREPPRSIFEVSGIDEQCIKVIGNVFAPSRPANRQCYICGLLIMTSDIQEAHPEYRESRGQKAFVPECEHILPVAEASQFLCLYDKRWGALVESQLDATLYVKMELEYAWAHHACNMVKNNLLFVTPVTDISGNIQFAIDEGTVRSVLNTIYTRSRKDSKALPVLLRNTYGTVENFIGQRLSAGSQLTQRLNLLCEYLTRLTNNDPTTSATLMYLLQSRLTKEAAVSSLSIAIDPAKRQVELAKINTIIQAGGNIMALEEYRNELAKIAEASAAATAAVLGRCEGGVCKAPNTPASHITINISRMTGPAVAVRAAAPNIGLATAQALTPAAAAFPNYMAKYGEKKGGGRKSRRRTRRGVRRSYRR